MKKIIKVSSLICLLFSMSSCLLIDGEFGFLDGAFIVFVIWVIIALLIDKQSEEKRKQVELDKQAWREEQAKVEAEKLQIKQRDYELENNCLVEQFGVADKTIQLVKNEINQEIRAYANRKKVFILGKEYDFSSILQCYYTDNSHIEKGTTTIKTTGTNTTDNGNMLGRAVVGGLLAGGAGAVIGGSTAKSNSEQTSVVNQGDDITRHDYTVWISVKDIANPMIKIPMGSKETMVNEIVALMNAIIASKDN